MVSPLALRRRGCAPIAGGGARVGRGRWARIVAMRPKPPLPAETRHLLELARDDRRRAREELAGMALEAQVALVCETPLSRRGEILDLVPAPERVVPELPEAELCYTIKAIGLEDAGWILEHASEAQVTACIDLDAWSGLLPDPARLQGWLEALADGSDATLLRSLRALDPEMVTLYLTDRVEVVMKPAESEGWDPPEGAQTLAGQFYVCAKREADELAALVRMLRVLFDNDYWLYFRSMQAVIWELQSELEHFALRWRTGRLQDLGFPPREECMTVYAFLKPAERALLAEGLAPARVPEWRLPVWMPDLPAAADSRHALFRAAAGLGAEERSGFFYAFVALANKVAVADGLPLAEPDSLPSAIEKAASVASAGLQFVAKANDLEAVEALRRVSLERLFRVGANLDPEAARAPRS